MLTQREADVLRAVVERYIKTAEPVGAKAIAEQRVFALSTASIRNTMAKLETAGYLTQPHTSAGRAPTVTGYRYYAETLMTPMRLGANELVKLRAATRGDQWREIAELLLSVSRALSSLSAQVALVGLASTGSPPIRSVHFIRIDDRLCHAVIVTCGGGIQNRLVSTADSFDQDALNKISAYYNDRFSGMSITKIRKKLFDETLREKNHVDLLAKWALGMAEAIDLTEDSTGLVFCDGGANLLNGRTGDVEIDRVRNALKTLEEKRSLVSILSGLLKSDGVNLMFGEESDFCELSDLSIVSHTFTGQNETMGAVGIIGPKMMDYSHAAALVSVTAGEIGRRLMGDA